MPELDLDSQRTALVGMGLQQGPVRRSAMWREQQVGERVGRALAAARSAGVLVVYVVVDLQPEFFSPNNKFLRAVRVPHLTPTGDDSDDPTGIVPEAARAPGEPIVTKPRISAFFGTPLDSMLRSRSIDTVVLMGLATELAVESSARYASDADFRVIVLGDCCASSSEEAHGASLAVQDRLATVAGVDDFERALDRRGGGRSGPHLPA